MTPIATAAQALAGLLRAAEDLILAHPELPTPYVTGIGYDDRGGANVDVRWFLQIGARDAGEQKRLAAAILRDIGGKWDKEPGDDFGFRQSRDGLRLLVSVEREAVCERVVTGTETVTIDAKPAEPARTVEREIVEWRCEPLLAEVSS